MCCTVLVRVLSFSLAARDSSKIEYIEAYLKANRMYRNYDDPNEDPTYSEVINRCHGDSNIVSMIHVLWYINYYVER